MHLQVLVDQLAERDRCRSPARPESCEHLLERVQRVAARRESTNLRPRRPAMPFKPVPVSPQRLTGRALRL